MRRPLRGGRVTLGVAIVGSALAISGCTAGSGATSSGGDGEGTESLEVASYDGAEIEFPAGYPEPEAQDVDCTIGYLNPTTAQPGHAAMQASAEDTAEGLGCEFNALRTNIDPVQQVNQFEQLLAQGVDAIFVSPIDPGALRPLLQKAADQGVPVIAHSLPATAQEEPMPNIATNILEGYDQKAYYPIATIAAAKPGAKFGIIGFGIPVPSLVYQTDQMKGYGEELELEFLGQQDSAGDSAGQYADAVTTLLTQHPDLEAIAAFNDTAAEAAVGVVRSSGRDVLVVGANKDPNAVSLVDNRQMLGTVDVQYVEKGKQIVWAAYNLITGQGDTLPEQVSIPLAPYVGEGGEAR